MLPFALSYCGCRRSRFRVRCQWGCQRGRFSLTPFSYQDVSRDVNRDGSVSVADVMAVVNILLGDDQVVSLDEELVSVRLHRAAVQKFKQEASYVFINDNDLGTLQIEIAPLVRDDEADIDALRFDALMYGFMCSLCNGMRVGGYQKRLVTIAVGLQQMITIPQVMSKLPVCRDVRKPRNESNGMADAFNWRACN